MKPDYANQKARRFSTYRRQATALARAILKENASGELDELALPAYSHPNPLMRWLFWQRLRKVNGYLKRTLPAGSCVLDFGCGVGMLLPLLADQGHRLTGVDLNVQHTAQFLEHFGVQEANILHAEKLSTLAPASFDVITALDVLEHVPDLDDSVGQLGRLLRPGGKLVICGPTENWLYKIGRKLAGFSGDYHVRNIEDIHTFVRRHFPTERIGTLYPGLPLFRLFTATRPAR